MSITWLGLLLLVIPVPWIAKMIWPREIKLLEVGVILLISIVLVTGIYFAGIAGQTMDREIWNGEITAKDRKHGTYEQPYECNCRESCSGSGKDRSCSTTCDTCYETHYTVSWTAYSNIGNFRLSHEDSTSRRVYNLPDPQRYVVVKVGDPCSTSNMFTNYVKAVPESLFHANPMLQKRFQALIPKYPGEIYDFYKINRVLAMGVNVPDIQQWNEDLSNALRKAGPQRQANAVVLFVNTPDPSYIHALESAWLGGKKNDILVVVGVTEYPKIEWVAVSSWSKAELFKVQLRDDLHAMKVVDRAAFMVLLEKHTMASFKRRSMADFEYLKDEIEPPVWVVVLAGILGLLAACGSTYYFYKNDPFADAFRSPYRNFR